MADDVIDVLLDGVKNHITHKRLTEIMVPFVTEDGLSVALEPSLLNNYCRDDTPFRIEDDWEIDEPSACPQDWHCCDKAKGPDKLQKRYE